MARVSDAADGKTSWTRTEFSVVDPVLTERGKEDLTHVMCLSMYIHTVMKHCCMHGASFTLTFKSKVFLFKGMVCLDYYSQNLSILRGHVLTTLILPPFEEVLSTLDCHMLTC